MTDLRSTVVWLTLSGTSWTVDEAATLAGATPNRAKAYLTHLARTRVILREGERYRCGPDAAAWRKEAAAKGNAASYGNSAEYQRQKRIREEIRTRAWQEGKNRSSVAPKETLTLQPSAAADRISHDDAGDVNMDQGRTLDEAASILAVSTDTIRRMISRGDIKAFAIGRRGLRVTSREIEAFIQRNAVPVTTISPQRASTPIA